MNNVIEISLTHNRQAVPSVVVHKAVRKVAHRLVALAALVALGWAGHMA